MTDNTFVSKNYFKNGGDELVIGGKLTVESGATVTGLEAGPAYVLPPATVSQLGGVKIGTGLSVTAEGVISNALSHAAYQADSTATELADLVTAVNALLAALRAAGLMEAEAPAGGGDA